VVAALTRDGSAAALEGRMRSRVNSIVLIVAGTAMLSTSCVMTGVQRYKESLIVTLLQVQADATNQRAVMARLRVENQGSEAPSFCIDGVAGSLTADNAPHCGLGLTVSHYGCQLPIILDPGTHVELKHQYPRPECDATRLCLIASAVFVDPLNCLYGNCKSVEVKSRESLCTELPPPRPGPAVGLNGLEPR
jgi:hypothetical protein